MRPLAEAPKLLEHVVKRGPASRAGQLVARATAARRSEPSARQAAAARQPSRLPHALLPQPYRDRLLPRRTSKGAHNFEWSASLAPARGRHLTGRRVASFLGSTLPRPPHLPRPHPLCPRPCQGTVTWRHLSREGYLLDLRTGAAKPVAPIAYESASVLTLPTRPLFGAPAGRPSPCRGTCSNRSCSRAPSASTSETQLSSSRLRGSSLAPSIDARLSLGTGMVRGRRFNPARQLLTSGRRRPYSLSAAAALARALVRQHRPPKRQVGHHLVSIDA